MEFEPASGVINNVSWQNSLIWIAPTIIILVFFSAVFSAIETAITSINVIRIKNLAKSHSKAAKKARRVYRLIKDFNTTLTTLLVANNLVNIALTTILTYFFDNQLGLPPKWSLLISILFSLFIILIFGEILPKNLARLSPEKIAVFFAYPTLFVKILFYPFAYIFSKLRPKNSIPLSTEQELLELISTIESEGVLERAESELITSAITFDEKTIQQAMQSRDKILVIYDDTTISELKHIYQTERYTRLPVVNRKTGKIAGIVNVKDVIIQTFAGHKIRLSDVLQKPLFMAKQTNLSEALEEMQKTKIHLAIVTSNKNAGDFLGIITLEDILEELVGEIYDEHDEIGNVQEIGHHKFQVNGKVFLNELFTKHLKDKPPETKSRTLLEWYCEISEIKEVNNSSSPFQYNNYLFSVNKVKKGNIIFDVEILTFEEGEI